jgi:hypothetical protein
MHIGPAKASPTAQNDPAHNENSRWLEDFLADKYRYHHIGGLYLAWSLISVW